MPEPVVKKLEIENTRGLHARASAKFANCVENFDADITVRKDGNTADGASIMELMMLGASKGSFIEVQAQGSDANAALETISALLASKFGEEN